MSRLGVAALLAATISNPSLHMFGQAAHASAKEAANVHAGEEVFQRQCFQCHSVIADQVRLGPSLYQETKGAHPKKTAAGVREILRNGKGRMPPFKDILTEEDTRNLIAYVKSL